MFPGQGSQYVNMGLELYQNVPLFRDQMDRCFEILKSVIGYDLKEIIYPIAADSDDSSELYSRINLTEITQPVIFAFEYALAKLVMACDIKPYAMIGHSIGEYTAACLAGVFSLEDALTLVSARGRLVSQMPGGAMLSVSIPQSELEPLLIPELSLAAVNGPSNCVVSGSYEAIDTFEKQLQEKGYNSSRLHVSHAFHSKMMEPVLKEFENLVKRVCLNRPVIPFISNVTGDWITVQDVKKPAYWAAHLRKTVRFTDGLSELLKTQNAIFVEVGPGKSLSTFARQHQDKKTEQVVLNLVRHPKENVQDKYYLLNQLGQLWLYGVKIDWSQFYVSEKCCRIPLPAYPFEQQSYQIGEEILKRKDIFPFQQFLKNQVNDLADFFYVPLWKPSITDVVQKEEMMGKTRILVFMDTCGIGEQLSEKLKKEGYDIIAVEQGIEFNKVQDRHYQINPTLINDYHALFNEFYQQDITPQFIVHLWNITRDSDDNLTNFTVEKFENAQYTGFYSLAYIIQAIKKQNMGNNFFKITVIANNIQDITGEENLCPAKATLLAGVIVIPQEWSNIRCFSIDIVLPKQESQQKDKLIQQLKTEILTESTETIIAYRNNRRWVQQFESVKMEKNREFTSRLKQAGVYLITGGLGKIGLVLTEYLARDFGARLILIGRSELPEREVWCNWLSTHNDRDSTSLKILKIQEIEKLGGEILIYSADVADQEQMKNIIARAEKQFGPINGVIHAAGITGGPSNQCATEKISKREGEEQFIPKVYGLLVLEKIFKDKELDFCMVMSSLSSVLGGLGFFAYSAANFFMDAFVKKYTKIHDSRWISVNWDGWQVGDNKDKWSISPKEGKNAFQLILDWGEENQVIVSKTDLQTRINQWVKIGHISESNVLKYENNSLLRKRPNLSTTYMQYRNQFEKALANIWEKFLGLDSIGIYDDFFELGGDSLKAITIIARIHKELNKNVSVAEFFNHPTIEELAKYINNSESIAYHSIKPIEKKEFYFQSSAQKRIYFLQQMDKESTAYHITSAWITEGILDRNKLEDTFVQLVKRHESFRTSFFTVGGELVQRIHVDVAFGIEYFGLTAKDANDCEDIHHSSFIIHHFIRPFDLSQAPLLRVGLVELEEKKHILLVDMHHIISDGISHKILLKDFIDIYIGKELLPLKFQYKDYSEWQNNKKKEIETKKQEEYWLREFKKDIPQLRIPTDYSRNSVQSFEGDIIKFCIAKEEVIKLKDMALEQEVTIFMLLLAIFYVFLFKLTGQEDILVGTGTAGRRHENLQHIIGMFVNTLVLRNYPQGKIYFHEFLHEIKEKILKAFENEDYQFEELVERVAPFNRDVSHNPLFNVMFQFQNIDIPQINITGLTLKPYQHETKISKFDMTLFSWESDQELSFMLEYSTELFKQETIEWFIEYFKRIMLSIIKNPSQKLSEIGSITCEKRKMKLQQFAHNLEAE
ncbi:MAG TPA: SDR family oxidoreductase [Candidatus Kapabacteria bacterium]|nr:SDR family oxidoreductase [Candidatus Kapabacteria bacterium]